MTEERLAEIKHNYENACGVAYERWDYSQGYPPGKMFDFDATEDMFELLAEVETLSAIIKTKDRQLEGERKGSQRAQAEVERLRKCREISREQVRQLFGEVARIKRVVEFIEQHADDGDLVRFFVKEALQNGEG